ncbi:uncharacterized protein [Typha latifolia]|uniref:uncharacterized protein isoform X2 n=2 Tax=Typha latifolia TaxID=4733 RepID=UPI003C3018B5
MIDDFDSIDDILLGPKETTEQAPGRFRPKSRSKTTKMIPGPSKASAAVEPLPPAVKPQSSASGIKQKEEGSSLSFSVLDSCTIAPDHHVVQESVDQTQSIDSECLTSTGDNEKILEPLSSEAADVLFGVDSVDDLINPVSAPGVVESMEASTISSSRSDLDVISSELHIAHAPQQQKEEAVIHIDASQDGFQVSEIDTKLHLDPDKFEAEEILEFCSTESQEETLFQISETQVKSIGNFQCKRQKEGNGISVSFVTPEASEAASPVETCSQMRVSSGLDLSVQPMTSDENLDNPLQSLPTIADGSGKLWQSSGEQTFLRERQHFNGGKDVGCEVRSQNVEDLEDVEDLVGPRSGNLEDVGTSRPSDDDLDIGDSNISQMDEDLNDASDDEYRAEDTTEQKKVPGKSRKKKNENEKPTQRHKRTSKKSDIPPEELPKAKFTHRVRRKRRLVDKILLDTPESEIDRRQISIKNLILLAEAKERNWNKEAEVLGKPSSNKSSTSSLPRKRNLDDFDFFGDQEEENHDNEETNHHIQQSSRKLNYHSYMNRSQSVRWSKSETELFYQAIRQFGTDFAMIQQLFPNRTRHQVKLKYKNEERKHPLQVHDTLFHRSKDHSHFEKVIQLLQVQAEQDPLRDTFENQETASQDNTCQNEEMMDNNNKKEEASGWADQAHSSINSNIGIHGDQSPAEANDFEGLFDWDLEDMEKDVFNAT